MDFSGSTSRTRLHGRFFGGLPRWVCHFAVLLAAWQGPVPWCHAHHATERHADASASLAAHLCLFHPGLDVHDHADLGWHFHFRMPGTGGEKGSDGPQARSALLRLKGERSETDLEGARRDGCRMWLPLACSHDFSRDLDPRNSVHRPRHFFESFTSQLSLAQRFGVYLI